MSAREASNSFFAWCRAVAGAPAARNAIARAATAGATGLPLASAVLSGLLLLSAADVDRVPPALQLGLGLLLGVSVWRPPVALVIGAAALPLSWWVTQTADLQSLRLAEAVVLAVLTGVCLRHACSPRGGAGDAPAPPRGVELAAAAVMAVAAAAAIVDLAPAQAGLSGAWLIVTDAVSQLSTDYLYGTAPVAPGLADAARLCEGTGLFLVVVAWSRRRAGLPTRLAVASLAGAAGAAAVNLSIGAEMILATDEPATMLLRELAGGRITVHSGMTNLSVTGEYFLMATWVGIGLVAGRQRAWLYGVATLATGATVWIVASRTQLGVALLTALAAGTIWLLRHRLAGRWRRALIGGALIAAVLLPVAIVTVYSQRAGVFDRVAAGDSELAELTDALYAQTARDLRRRVEFAATGLRIWATAPVFGVGAGRYHGLSTRFMSPWLLDFYPSGANAHNNYLQIAAELGAVGLAAFLWLLAAAGWSVWRAARNRPHLDPLMVGSAAGTAAFLAASLTGHPLLLGETAYPFWIVAGVALALASRQDPPASAPAPAPARAKRLALIGWTIVPVFLLVTLPVRIDGAAHTLMRANARDGLDGLGGVFGVEIERSGDPPFRWTGPRATFFTPRDSALVLIPLRAPHAQPDRPVAVDIAVAGRRIMRVPLRDPAWVQVAAPLGGPPRSNGFQRVDLIVDPLWAPRDRRNGDPRTLGVQLRALSGQQWTP